MVACSSCIGSDGFDNDVAAAFGVWLWHAGADAIALCKMAAAPRKHAPFVAAIEFGPKVKAYSLLAGGQSGDPKSAHFFDQAENYAHGNFKPVLFYKKDVIQHVVKKYRPFNN